MSSATTPLAVRELTVRYGTRTALAGVSLAVEAGSVYALLGLNGAGKSSLVRCALGLQKPERGRALLFERDVWRHRVEVLADVGVVAEEPDASPALSAAELGRFSARVHERWNAAGYGERLRRFGVPADVPFGRLSKGQKGQVALSLALATTPRLLLLDDPTLGLDPIARRSVFEELIGELAERGTTVFLTTHELNAVEGLADRIGILRDGRLLVDEELEALRGRFRRLRFAEAETRLESALPALGALVVERKAWGVEALVSHFSAAGEEELRALGQVEVEAVGLEDVFFALAGAAGQGGAA